MDVYFVDAFRTSRSTDQPAEPAAGPGGTASIVRVYGQRSLGQRVLAATAEQTGASTGRGYRGRRIDYIQFVYIEAKTTNVRIQQQERSKTKVRFRFHFHSV